MTKDLLLKPITRRAVIAGSLTAFFAQSFLAKAFSETPGQPNVILGRPTNSSIAISVMSLTKQNVFVEYGTTKSSLSKRSKEFQLVDKNPSVIELTGLKSNTKYYYRLKYKASGTSSLSTGKTHSFSTAKTAGKSFSFSLHGDTHPERAGKMFNADLYSVTLANIAAQQPDFHILMGDDFSIDPLISKNQATKENVEKIYSTHRNWLATAGASVPMFLVNGNHEQAAAYLLNGTSSSPAVLAGNARLKYFPLPAPNAFYSGNTTEIPDVGLPRDYYSWTWGDALFITLDPYWHSPNAVDNVAGTLVAEDQGSGKGNNKSGAGAGKASDLWKVGIGDEQYAWLKKTLETSNAKFKFVFAHHVLGTGRGAIEVSTNYEWGGKDPKGVSTFEKERPNWELPIHDLMVKNGVSIFFQGHDHIFVTQERDGLIYQSMPNPADDSFSMFNDAAYKSGTKAPNSGHVRVTVSPVEAKVEYFLAARAQDSGRKNLSVAHSYSVPPRSSS